MTVFELNLPFSVPDARRILIVKAKCGGRCDLLQHRWHVMIDHHR